MNLQTQMLQTERADSELCSGMCGAHNLEKAVVEQALSFWKLLMSLANNSFPSLEEKSKRGCTVHLRMFSRIPVFSPTASPTCTQQTCLQTWKRLWVAKLPLTDSRCSERSAKALGRLSFLDFIVNTLVILILLPSFHYYYAQVAATP